MPINLATMRTSVAKPAGVNQGGTSIPDDELDLYLNRSFWEVQNKFPFREKEVVSTFNTIAGARHYDVSFPTEAVKHVAIQEIESGQFEHVPLIQITRNQYESSYSNNTNQRAIPEWYLREGCVITLFPTPDKVYNIIIKRLVALSDLSNSNINSNIPQVWDEILIFGAIWRLCVDLGDLNKSNWFKSLQAEMINTIIPTEVQEAQSNSQLAHVEVPGLEY